VTADRRRLAGADLDAVVDRANETGGSALREVREALGRTATDVYAEYADVDRERAREAVRAGTWTRDPVAAAFLAGEAGPDPGLAARARLWLVPERERARRVERTVRAIEGLGGRS
jgi:sugar (pentulose or hexulose) kinase